MQMVKGKRGQVLRRGSGQGTLEYILVLVVILLAILASTTKIRTALETQVFDNAEGQIKAAGDAWANVQ